MSDDRPTPDGVTNVATDVDSLANATGLGPVSARTKALAKRSGHVALSNDVARAPMATTTLAAPLDSNGAPATAAQTLTLALAIKRYAEGDCPLLGWVSLAPGDVAHLLRLDDEHSLGGWDYKGAKALIYSLHYLAVAVETVDADGLRVTTAYNPIDTSRVASDGTVSLHLNAELQRLIRSGRFTALNVEKARRLRAASGRSDAPFRLWAYLESQRLPWAAGWPVFRAPEGAKNTRAVRAQAAPISEVLGLTGHQRRKVVARVRAAARVVMDVFPEYVITVAAMEVATMYQLHATRRAALTTEASERATIEPDDTTARSTSARQPSVLEGYSAPVDNSADDTTAQRTSGVQPSVLAGYSKTEETPGATLEDGLHKGLRAREDQDQSLKKRTTGVSHETQFDHEQSLGSRHPCSIRHRTDQLDPHHDLADILGVDLRDSLAVAICEQGRKVSGGAACSDPATCIVINAHCECGRKWLRYLKKRNHVGHPEAWARGILESGVNDPAELLGGDSCDAEHRLAELRGLEKHSALSPLLVDLFNFKRMDA